MDINTSDPIYQCSDIYEGIDRMIKLGLSHIILTDINQYHRMCMDNRWFYDKPIQISDGTLSFEYRFKDKQYYAYAYVQDDAAVFKVRQILV